MSYADAVLILLLTGAAAALATLLIQRQVGVDLRRNHHEVGSVVFLQVGVVFAVLLAFVFSEAWSEYNEAAQAIDLEVGALHGAAMLASTLPAGPADEILSAERAYVESVASQEWPVMARDRTEDDQTDHRLQDLITDVAELRLDGHDNDTRNQILPLLAQAHAQRETRIFQAHNGIPGALWLVLVAFTAVLVVSVSFSGIDNRATSIAMAGGFAVAITSILVVLRLLDYPFEGALALEPDDYISVLGKISGLLQR